MSGTAESIPGEDRDRRPAESVQATTPGLRGSSGPKGGVYVPRQILNSPAFRSVSPWVWKTYSFFLLRARWKDGEVETYTGTVRLLRGQVLVGAEQLERKLSSRRHRFTRKIYRRTLECLANHKLIDLQSTSYGTIVTVVGYDDLVRIPKAEEKRKGRGKGHPEGQRVGRPVGHDGAGVGATIEEGKKEGRRKTVSKENAPKKEGVCAEDTHAPFLVSLSGKWKTVKGEPIRWSPGRRSQVLQLLENFQPQDLLAALDKFKEVRELKDPYLPRDWGFERFFTVATVEELLTHKIDYYRLSPDKRRCVGHLDDLVGQDALKAYNGEAGDDDNK